MELSAALLYSLRYIPKLLLPQVIAENISKLRLVPAAYNKPIRASLKPRHYENPKIKKIGEKKFLLIMFVELEKRQIKNMMKCSVYLIKLLLHL